MGKKVVVFGIFDGVHDGHRDLFRQAKEFGDELIVIVGRDEVALKFKGKRPKYLEDERVSMLKKEELVSDVVLGDREPSTYRVLEELNPDVVCFGYDQQALAEDLQKWLKERRKEILIRILKSYKPGLFHSSLLK